MNLDSYHASSAIYLNLFVDVQLCIVEVRLTERALDVLLSCIDLWQELLEELQPSSEPQQSLCGRVAHPGNIRLDFVQHDGL